MMRTTAADFVRRFGDLGDEALKEPIVISRNGRDRLVVLNISEFSECIDKVKRSDPDAQGRERLDAISNLIAEGRQ